MAEKWLFLLDEVFIFPYNKLVIPCVVLQVLKKRVTAALVEQITAINIHIH